MQKQTVREIGVVPGSQQKTIRELLIIQIFTK